MATSSGAVSERKKETRRFKYEGAVKGYYDIAIFRTGDWMEWLELRRQLKQLKVSWELDDSVAEDNDKFLSVIRQVIYNQDLRLFNETYAMAVRGTNASAAIESALRAVNERHCPPDVTTVLRGKLSDLSKRRDMSVDQYANEFEDLLELGEFVRMQISANDTLDLFHRGMPTAWRERVEILPIRNQDEALVELRAAYKTCERLERARPARDKFQPPHRGRGGQNHSGGRHHNHRGQSNQHGKKQGGHQGKRKAEGAQSNKSCDYCKGKGWDTHTTHNSDDCFRNPDSPNYRPRANKNKRFKLNENPGNEVALMQHQMGAEVDNTTLEELYAERRRYDVATLKTETAAGRKMRVRVQLCHPLSGKTFTGILGSGCNKSTVAKEVVSWYRPKTGGTFATSDGTHQNTLGRITLPFRLEEFHTRQVAQEFQIADKLLYPVILGTDFMEEQGIILDFKNKTLNWDEQTMPIEDASADPRKLVLIAEVNETGDGVTTTTAQGKQVNLDAFIPKEHLTLEQQQRLKQALQRVRVVFTQDIGS